MKSVVKDHVFELVSELVKPDAKKRLSLGSTLQEPSIAYQVYRNRLGQIILDPVKAVPTYEAWLFENPCALDAVRTGLAESAEEKTLDLGSFAKHAKL